MDTRAASLLRRLAGGVRPVDGPPPRTDGPAADFTVHLRLAREGVLRTGLAVSVPASVLLDDAEREALSEAADEAAAMGVAVALVQVGERCFRVDLAERAVVEEVPPERRVVADIDGLVRPAPDPGDVRQGPGGPARVVRNASLVRSLADAADAPD